MSALGRRAWAVGRKGRGTRFWLGGIGLVAGAAHPKLGAIGLGLCVVGLVLQLTNREEEG